LFSVGTTLGTDDECFNFCGDADLTVQTAPNFKLDMNARAKFQELRSTAWEDADRTGFADIQYTAPATLHATASTDLYYPVRAISLVEAHGSLDLLLSPDAQHFYLGWPVDSKPIVVKIGLDHVQQETFSGGLGLELKGSDLDTMGHGPPWFAFGLSWSGDIGPLSATIDGGADIAMDANTPGKIASFKGDVSAEGEADFGLFSADATGTLTLFYIAKGEPFSLAIPGSNPATTISGTTGKDQLSVSGEVTGCVSAMGGTHCQSVGVERDF